MSPRTLDEFVDRHIIGEGKLLNGGSRRQISSIIPFGPPGTVKPIARS